MSHDMRRLRPADPVVVAPVTPASRVARYRATLAVIDRAHRFGRVLAQEEAADLVDAAIGTYVAHLSAPERSR